MEGSSSPKLAALLAFFHRFGEVMGSIVLGFLYFVLVGPVALVARLATDPLRRRRPSESAFAAWQKDNETLAAAHRQG
ncbi:MAG: hypothetical protein AB1689_27765 [Thermodesulfobacteriota bacterium]